MFRIFGFLLVLFASAAHAAMQQPERVVYLPGFDRERIVSEDILVVRAFTSAMADRKEYAGARCQAESNEFRIVFVTPATLAVPRIHKRPSVLRIRCQSYRGDGRLTIRPSHPGYSFPTINPLARIAFVVLATTQNHNRDDWTYVPRGLTRSVTLQWATRAGCVTTSHSTHCTNEGRPAAR